VGWRTSMIKSIVSLVIGFNLFLIGILGFMIFYSTAQTISQIAATELPELPKLTDDRVTLNDTEYSIKMVTIGLNLTKQETNITSYIWFAGGVERIDVTEPTLTLWVDVDNWIACARHQLTNWTDNGDGKLSSSDNITLVDLIFGGTGKSKSGNYTVERVTTYIFVNLVDQRTYLHLYAETPNLVDTSDPVGTEWFELYPRFSRVYDLASWEDVNNDEILSPADIPEISMVAWSGPGMDGKWGTADDATGYMPTIFTPEMKQFMDGLSADFDPLVDELLGLTEDTKAMAEEMSLLSYLLLGMAIIGVVLMVFGAYKGFKIGKEAT
jgi:hypothetical protein